MKWSLLAADNEVGWKRAKSKDVREAESTSQTFSVTDVIQSGLLNWVTSAVTDTKREIKHNYKMICIWIVYNTKIAKLHPTITSKDIIIITY